MDWAEIILKIVTTLVTVAIAPCLMLITKEVLNYFKAKYANTTYANVSGEVCDTIYSVVESLNQTLAGPLKDAAADGKLTDDEKKQILDLAIEKVKGLLTAQAYKYFIEHNIDMTDYIETRIEAYIAGKKV